MGDALSLNGGFQLYLLGQYEDYIRAAKGKERSFVAIQKMITADLDKKLWPNAIAKIDKYTQLILSEGNYLDSLSPTITKLKDLKDILAKPFDVSIVPKNWGEPVNSFGGGEYSPILSADGNTLYFLAWLRKDNFKPQYTEHDIFISKKIKNKWTVPKLVKELSNPNSNEGVEHSSSDGTNLIVYIDGALTSVSKVKNGWDAPKPLNEINQGDWQADATFSSDNNAIFFASARATNFNTALNNLSII
jgi:hypothetical protein